MKKLLGILVLCAMFVLPMRAYAFDMPVDCEETCKNDNDQCIKTCKLKITGNTTTLTKLDVKITVTEGINILEVNPATGWINNGLISPISFENIDGTNASSFDLATIVFDVTNAGEDCLIEFQLNDVTKKIRKQKTETVNTGVSLPLVILLGGVALAGTVYVISRKSTKMYKI